MYKLICVDEQYSKPFKIYFGKDVIDKFLYDMVDDSKFYCRVIERERKKKKSLFMIEKNYDLNIK